MDATMLRVRYTFDDDARFEECNGKLFPLDAQEYAVNTFRACPTHPRSKVEPVLMDPPDGRAWCGECGTEYADVPYSEYLAYYGNPERHVFLECIVEKECACCGHWSVAASLCGIDLMDDDPGYLAVNTRATHRYTVAEALALPGHLGDVARDLVLEAQNS